MSILVSQKILDHIREELSRSTESFLLISAYCKLPLVKYFDSCITNSNVEKKLVVRFRPDDIVSGASDLEIYPYCRDNGWKLYFRLDLHAKTYVFDRLRCIIGSANATSSGLSIGGTGNYEMATLCELAEKDVLSLDLLLLGSVEMNDKVYELMKKSLHAHSKTNVNICTWPKDITDMFKPDYSLLFAEDFPTCSSPSVANAEELVFLNIVSGASIECIRSAFQESKCFKWLLHVVAEQENHEIYFGALSASLHNSLLNEPKPYRKDVKLLLSNLLGWIEELDIEYIQIDRPNYSQRIRYIK